MKDYKKHVVIAIRVICSQLYGNYTTEKHKLIEVQVVKLYFQYHLYFERSNSPATNCELHLLLTLSHKSQVLPLTVHQIIKIKEKYRIESYKSNKHSIKKISCGNFTDPMALMFSYFPFCSVLSRIDFEKQQRNGCKKTESF